jgi:hypothetical protein
MRKKDCETGDKLTKPRRERLQQNSAEFLMKIHAYLIHSLSSGVSTTVGLFLTFFLLYSISILSCCGE